MSEFPKDGSTFVVESIDRTAYRWAKYKPDGARQMGKPGRWQKQVWSGDYFKWENCEEPVGEIAPAMEDGPISGAVKAIAAKDAEIARLREALGPFVKAFARRRDAYAQRHQDRDLGYANFDKMPDDWAMEKVAFNMGAYRRACAALAGGSDATV